MVRLDKGGGGLILILILILIILPIVIRFLILLAPALAIPTVLVLIIIPPAVSPRFCGSEKDILLKFAQDMNTSGSSTVQQCCTGPNWAAENNWEQNSGVTALEPRLHIQGNNNSGGRLDWGWDNAMLLSQHHHNHHHTHAGGGDHPVDRKAHVTAAAALVNSGGIRSSLMDGVLPASGFASNLAHGHMGVFSANPGLRTFAAGMESSPAGLHFLGGLTDIVKRENVDGFNRIGLNLGGRTYFSSEDSGSGRLVKRPRGNAPGSQVPMCQAEGCKADLTSAKHYHRRHKVCELHSKAATVITNGQSQRFCQQCSRFHMLSEFDDGKRSCRKRLADHNRRRRKPQPNSDGSRIANGESTALKDDAQDSSANNRSTGSQANSVSGSDSQALLSAISLSPPASVTIHNNNNSNSNSNNNHNHNSNNNENQNQRQQLSIVSGSSQAEAMYQYLQVVPQTGPQLSLSSLAGPGVTAIEDQWQQRGPAGPRKYDCIEPSVPWLRHNTGGSRTESAMNLQPIMATKSSDNNSASSNGSCSQVFSPSVQNLLPIQSSRSSISTSGNWVMNNIQQATHNREHSGAHFGNICNMNVHGSLEGHPVLSLLETSTFRDQNVRNAEGAAAGRQQRAAVEFLHQQTSSSETESSRSGSGHHGDVKFPDLQTLRPFASTPIYDAANSGLL